MNKVIIVLIIVFMSSNVLLCQEDSKKAVFDSAIELYQANDYKGSAEIYHQLIKEGYRNKETLFNLANCYAKMEDIPLAILYFERALRHDPGNKDIIHNLNLTRQKIGTEIVEVPDFFLLQYWHNISSVLNANTWTILYMLSFAAFIYFFYRWLMGKDRDIKKKSFFLSIFLLSFCVLCFFAAKTKTHLEFGKHEGVIIVEELYLKSGPDNKSKDQRLLYGGVKLEIVDKIGSWYKVQLANNEFGWIQKDKLEII